MAAGGCHVRRRVGDGSLLITSLSLAQRLVPKALVTEGMAVAITGILIGISAGSAVGGWAIEAWGAQLAYAVPVVSGGLALSVIAIRYRHLEGAELAGGRALGPDSTRSRPERRLSARRRPHSRRVPAVRRLRSSAARRAAAGA